jgi:hypothetical protein
MVVRVAGWDELVLHGRDPIGARVRDVAAGGPEPDPRQRLDTGE